MPAGQLQVDIPEKYCTHTHNLTGVDGDISDCDVLRRPPWSNPDCSAWQCQQCNTLKCQVCDQFWVFLTAGQIYKFPPLSEADLWNFRFQLTLHHKIYSPRSSCAKSSKSTGSSGPLLFAALARPCNAFKTLLHAVPWYALGLADWGISWHRQRLLTNVIGVGSAFGGDNWGHQHLNRPQYLAQQTTRRGCSGAWQQKCRNNLLGKSERATV